MRLLLFQILQITLDLDRHFLWHCKSAYSFSDGNGSSTGSRCWQHERPSAHRTVGSEVVAVAELESGLAVSLRVAAVLVELELVVQCSSSTMSGNQSYMIKKEKTTVYCVLDSKLIYVKFCKKLNQALLFVRNQILFLRLLWRFIRNSPNSWTFSYWRHLQR